MDISIIIVSFNTKEFLKKCLDSIVKYSPSDLKIEVIVVDNASTDGTISAINNTKLQLNIIENKTNVGFSKANNIGVKHSSGKYVLFLNPDTEISKGLFKTMNDFMQERKDVAAATSKVVLFNGQLDDACHRGFPTPWNAFCYFSGLSKLFPKSKLLTGYNLGSLDLSTVHEIDACAGAFMLVRREAGEQVGWWDEDYFWYGDDLDFCYRLKQNSGKIFFVPTVSILHYKGVSGGIKSHSKNISTASKQTRLLATKSRFDAMRVFYKKHYVKKYPKIITWLVFVFIDIKLFFSQRFIS